MTLADVDDPMVIAMKSLPTRVTCSGMFDGDDSSLYQNNAKPKQSLGSLFDPSIEKLKSLATPSKFGQGTDTVYDETVRKGLEVTADQLVVSLGGKYTLEGLQDDIRRNLFPRATSLRFEFYKLAMYESGGHFDYHRDTVHGPNHLATLLVEVKALHEGGALWFQHEGEEWVGADFSQTTSEDNIHYIAFYTDVLHKVAPVTKGIRAVLQFDVLVEQEPKSDEEVNHDEDDDEDNTGEPPLEPFAVQVRKEVVPVECSEGMFLSPSAKLAWLKEVRQCLETYQTVAIPLFHRYAGEHLTPTMLKSIDRALFETAISTPDLLVGYCPIKSIHESNYVGNYAKGRHEVVRAQPIQECFFQEGGQSVPETHWLNMGKTLFVTSRTSKSYLVNRTNYIEYTGNDAQRAESTYLLMGMFLALRPTTTPPSKKQKVA